MSRLRTKAYPPLAGAVSALLVAEVVIMPQIESDGDASSMVCQCDDCGKAFIGTGNLKTHQHFCGEENVYNNTPTDDNEDFKRFLAWLKEVTDGRSVKFKGRTIADDVDLSTKQIGTFMHSVDAKRDEFTVNKLGYSSSTMWEVSQS